MNQSAEIPRNTAQTPPPRTTEATETLRAALKVTPRTYRSSVSGQNVPSTCNYVLDSARDDFLQCPLESFYKHYLPFNPDKAVVAAALENLRVGGLLENGPDGAPCWRDFHGPQGETGTPEPQTYRPLKYICAVLQGGTIENRQPHCEFVEKPSSTTQSEQEGSSHMVGGYLRMTESTVPGHNADKEQSPTSDIAVVCEFRRDLERRLENRTQLLTDVVHGLNSDPCRNHMYGITIENQEMSIWYFSRSHCVVSDPFDFTKDHERFVAIVLSFLFANPGELGYDADLRRQRDENKDICYVYKIGDAYYRTISQIDEHQSGRVTRVWKAIEIKSANDLRIKDGAPEVVIRDIWLQDGARTEKAIQDSIFASLGKVAVLLNNEARLKDPGPDDDPRMIARINAAKSGADWVGALECVKNRRYGDYFLRIDSEGFGAKTKDKAPNTEPGADIFNPTKYPTVQAAKLPGANRSSIPTSTSNSPGHGEPRAPNVHREFSVRKRHFLVYTEVCVALQSLADYGDVLTGLEHAVMALRLLFLAGWVHRDISAGNILLYKPPGGTSQGKIGDLEYAREYVYDVGGTIGSDPKTGTAIFMPVEIQKSMTFFDPAENEIFSLTPPASPKPNPPPVIHNFGHDLESAFWIFLWLLARRVEPVCRHCVGDCGSWWEKVFQNSLEPSQEREAAFTRPWICFNRLLTHWTAGGLPEPFRLELANCVNYTVMTLFKAYKTRGDRFDEPQTYHDLYQSVEKTIRESRRYPDAKLRALSVFGQTGTKRKVDGPDEGGEKKRSRTADDDSYVLTRSQVESQGEDN
ncbi:hypothetical protein FRB99_008646 [Tulasnella sp. 403]|nr:hypothetical protein FRB99_008646 [Tulasnella sp. 403]